MTWLTNHHFDIVGYHCPIPIATNTWASLSTLVCLMMLTLWNRTDLCMLGPTWLFVNLRLHHHWEQRLCHLMHIVHLYMAVRSDARCISTPIVNWMLHNYNDAFRQLLQEPRWCSASQLFVANNVSSFAANVRILAYSLWRSLSSSDNVLVNTALRSDLLVRSPVFRRWRNILF